MRSYPTTAAGSPLRELILIRCTAACPSAALAALSFSSDLQHISTDVAICKQQPLLLLYLVPPRPWAPVGRSFEMVSPRKGNNVAVMLLPLQEVAGNAEGFSKCWNAHFA